MKFIRYLLFPFSVLYGCVLAIRNFLFDYEFLESKSFPVPVISVGNLNMGGTGKSPMIEFLISQLQSQFTIATLSRGYKRTTEGFLEVKPYHKTSEVGDEPLQFKTNFPAIVVAVDANRQRGISKLLQLKPEIDLILLDDAFQHRKVKPNFSILLTAFQDLYTDDFVLPTGNLREFSSGAKRADVVVVTKCPNSISSVHQSSIRNQLRLQPHQHLFFSTIVYSDAVCSGGNETEKLSNFDDFTLVTGIANPKPLVKYLNTLNKNFKHIQFSDHHEFSEEDLSGLKKQSKLLTTQKDYMRLKSKLNTDFLFYLPIENKIINDSEFFINHLKETIS